MNQKLLAATAILACLALATPVVLAARPSPPAPPTAFYFHTWPVADCPVYTQCYNGQPANTTYPSRATDAVMPLKDPRYYEGINWYTPYWQTVNVSKNDVLRVEVWMDGTIGTDGNLENVQVALFNKNAWVAGTSLFAVGNLSYVPGTGTLTGAAVVAGKFAASGSGFTLSGAQVEIALRTLNYDGGQIAARYDSPAAPSCFGINVASC